MSFVVSVGDVVTVPVDLPVEWVDAGLTSTTLTAIVRAAADVHDLSVGDVLSDRRGTTFARPRQQAMYLASKLTPYSLTRIGRHFHRDHTTVMHAIRVATARLSEGCPIWTVEVRGIKQRLDPVEQGTKAMEEAKPKTFEKTCSLCGDTKPVSEFYLNRHACKACYCGKTRVSELRKRALRLYQDDGKTIKELAAMFARGERTIHGWLREEGADTSICYEQHICTNRGHPDAAADIGKVPPDSPFADLDRAILREREAAGMTDGRRRPMANPWPEATSLAVLSGA